MPITAIRPQFLVSDLDRALIYYRDRLGFTIDFQYQDFYASVSRDGYAIHLKCAEVLPAERALRKKHQHLDAYVEVLAVRDLFAELERRGAMILEGLEQQEWKCLDFYVEDPDGHILCFSEPTV